MFTYVMFFRRMVFLGLHIQIFSSLLRWNTANFSHRKHKQWLFHIWVKIKKMNNGKVNTFSLLWNSLQRHYCRPTFTRQEGTVSKFYINVQQLLLKITPLMEISKSGYISWFCLSRMDFFKKKTNYSLSCFQMQNFLRFVTEKSGGSVSL